MSRSTNHWHTVGPNSYSKIYITPEEQIWLEVFAPDATIEKKRVNGYKHMPSYKMGRWNGYTTVVTFTDRGDAVLFKLTWWNV